MSQPLKIPGLNPQKDGSLAMTMEVPNGNLNPGIMTALSEAAAMPGVTVHITTAQKIMFLGLDSKSGKSLMEKMEAAGAVIRKGRNLSHARTCVGRPWCKYGWHDTFALGEYLYKNTAKEMTAPKFKVGIAGCPACCSWANMLDLGFVGVKSGWKVFVGGHGGAIPQTGLEITKITSHEEAAEITMKLARLFTDSVKKKSRMDRIIRKMGGIEELKKELGFS